MGNWAAEWSGAKDVFKDATKMDKPENVKKFLGIVSVNSSNINSALKKVDAEFKKHDDFLKLAEKTSWDKRDKVMEAGNKIVAATKSAINGYQSAADNYSPKLKSVIDEYKEEKSKVKEQQAKDEKSGKTVSPTDLKQLKTSYVRGIQLLDKQLASISAGIAAELNAFEKKKEAVLGRGSEGEKQAAASAAALALARAGIKKAAAFVAQAKAVVGGAYDGKAEREPARTKAFETLLNKSLPEAAATMTKARQAGVHVPNAAEEIFNPKAKRWLDFIYDGNRLDHAMSEFAKDLKWLDAELAKNNK